MLKGGSRIVDHWVIRPPLSESFMTGAGALASEGKKQSVNYLARMRTKRSEGSISGRNE